MMRTLIPILILALIFGATVWLWLKERRGARAFQDTLDAAVQAEVDRIRRRKW